MGSACARKNIRSGFRDIGRDLHAMLEGELAIGDFSWVTPFACRCDRIAVGSSGHCWTRNDGDERCAGGASVIGTPAYKRKRLLRPLSDLAADR